MSDDIRPGVPTASMLGAIQRWRVRVYENARRVAQLQPRPVRKFPARLTAVHAGYSPARYSWSEEWWDETGVRQLRPGGRSGTDSFNPAFGYGDGTTVEAGNLPQQVWLTERVEATDADTGDDLGMVYEFPAYCACESGGGGGYVIVPCCPNPIPTVLYATMSVPGCGCGLDGFTFTLGWVNTGYFAGWISDGFPADLCGGAVAGTTLQIFCNPVGFPDGWYRTFTAAPSNTCLFTPEANIGMTVSSCHPFSATVYATLGPSILGACTCDGRTVTVTITE